MTVSDRYWFGVSREFTTEPPVTRTNGMTISHRRRRRISRTSSVVYLFPGITQSSFSMPDERRAPREADPYHLTPELAAQAEGQQDGVVEAVAVVRVLRVDAGAAAHGDM